MNARIGILAVLTTAAIAATASSTRGDKRKDADAVPPARAAEDQGTALKLAKSQDLPALEKADRAVIVQPVSKKRVSIADAAVLKRLRTALVVRDVPPSGGMTEYEIPFYRGKQLLRKVWVYVDGEWGVVPPKPPHWTTGRSPALKKLLEELVSKE